MKRSPDIFNILTVAIVIVLVVFLMEGLANKSITKLPACFSGLFVSKSSRR